MDKFDMKPIVVIGMHRSGSSALTELLTSFGYYFGEVADGIGANEENVKGFWERRDVRDVNDEILYGLDCEWDAISQYDISELNEKKLDYFTKATKSVVSKLENIQPNWVIKEPRMCLTYPIWRESLEQTPLIIYIHREPIEIANSLKHRNSISIDYGLDLWYRYSLHALNNISGHKVLFLSYSDLSSDPLTSAAKISDFLHDNSQEFEFPTNEKILSIIEPKLKHQKSNSLNESLSLDQSDLNSYIHELISNQVDTEFMFNRELKISPNTIVEERALFFDKYINQKKEIKSQEALSIKLKIKRNEVIKDNEKLNVIKKNLKLENHALNEKNIKLTNNVKHLTKEMEKLANESRIVGHTNKVLSDDIKFLEKKFGTPKFSTVIKIIVSYLKVKIRVVK
ncbi:sulfotransferase family protein [Vibrio tasmaniensis]|uniref:sulfotransferase family protein n=1 Tax=Vibrio tasmaniensis TaxID=212663 RepID=UPI00107F8BD9|nr:sulfotransferase [Vibrio tasmaniensis]